MAEAPPVASTAQDESESKPLRHYCITHLSQSLGQMFAQLQHSAGESFYALRDGPENPSGTYAISLAAKDEQHLIQIEQKLIQCGIPHVAIREPDRNNELCSIGIIPTRDTKKIKKITGGLPLIDGILLPKTKGEQNGS